MNDSSVMPPARNFLPARHIVDRNGSISIVNLQTDLANIGLRSRHKGNIADGIERPATVLHGSRVALGVATGCNSSPG